VGQQLVATTRCIAQRAQERAADARRQTLAEVKMGAAKATDAEQCRGGIVAFDDVPLSVEQQHRLRMQAEQAAEMLHRLRSGEFGHAKLLVLQDQFGLVGPQLLGQLPLRRTTALDLPQRGFDSPLANQRADGVATVRAATGRTVQLAHRGFMRAKG
jgi:hypothetical protein